MCTEFDAAAFDDLSPDAALSLLERPAVGVFKTDRRRRVWLVEDEAGRRWVVKRFGKPSLRQNLSAMTGRHPVQREVLWHGRLIEAGLAVTPVVASGTDAEGRRYVVTPYLGPTLFEVLRQDPPPSAKRRHHLTRQVGELAGRLLALRVFYRDFKATNLVVTQQDEVVLIDAGDCRGGKGTPLFATALRMLELLHRHTQRFGPDDVYVPISGADRMRFFRAMIRAWPTPPDGLQHLLRHPEFEKKYE